MNIKPKQLSKLIKVFLFMLILMCGIKHKELSVKAADVLLVDCFIGPESQGGPDRKESYVKTSNLNVDDYSSFVCQWTGPCTLASGKYQLPNTRTAAIYTSSGAFVMSILADNKTVTQAQIKAATSAKQIYIEAHLKSEDWTMARFQVTGVKHTHTWASTYSYDANNHWIKCTSCSATKNVAAHSYTVDSGVQYSAATCTKPRYNYKRCACGYNPKSSSHVVAVANSQLAHSYTLMFVA